MKITVQRKHKTLDGMFGVMTFDWNPFTCYTVENLELEIAPGLYDLIYEYSPHFNKVMPHLVVPGRTFIMIHWANYPNQLEGCIAVGDKEEPDAIDDSIITFNQLAKVLGSSPGIKIEVKDIEPLA